MYETVSKDWKQDAADPVAEPESPRALNELASAAQALAEASNVFITARRNLGFAQSRFSDVQNMVSKARESENV